MSILVELQERVKVALKAGDKEAVSALRMIVNELQKAAKEARRELDDVAEQQVLKREHKRRLESIEAFRAGGREDLAVHEEYAARIVAGLLPQQLDEAAVVGVAGSTRGLEGLVQGQAPHLGALLRQRHNGRENNVRLLA